MGQPTQVDPKALREAAKAFHNGAEALRARAIPAIAHAGLPSFALPVLDMGYGANYRESYTGMDLACKLTCNVMQTIDTALTRVANHYQGQDDKNAEMFHGKPIPPPTVPTGNAMPVEESWGGAALDSIIAVGETGAVTAMIAVALAGLGVSSARAGGAAIIVPFGLFCLLNLRDPMPHLDAAVGWAEVESVLADISPAIQKQVHDVTGTAQWQGDGANAFNSYVSNKLAPLVDAANSLAGSMKSGCYEAAAGLASALVLFIVATYTAIATCLAADADPEPLTATAIIWATLGMWHTFIIEIVLEMVAVFVLLGIAAAGIASSYKGLAGWLKDADGRINGQSANLAPEDTTRIQDWQSWKK